jgi:hypothetical protein
MSTKGAAPPSFLRAADLFESAAAELARLQADNERLRGKVGRFQGVPLPLIEAINAAMGSNDWQGDHSQAELLGPACRAIAELEARKPLPLSDEQIEGLREQTFSTNNPFCPCDSKTMREAVRAAERAHGITGGSS